MIESGFLNFILTPTMRCIVDLIQDWDLPRHNTWEVRRRALRAAFARRTYCKTTAIYRVEGCPMEYCVNCIRSIRGPQEILGGHTLENFPINWIPACILCHEPLVMILFQKCSHCQSEFESYICALEEWVKSQTEPDVPKLGI